MDDSFWQLLKTLFLFFLGLSHFIAQLRELTMTGGLWGYELQGQCISALSIILFLTLSSAYPFI